MASPFASARLGLSSALGLLALLAGCGGSPPPPPAAVAVPEGSARFVAGGDSRDDSAHVMPWALREARARGASAFLYLGDMELTPQLDCHFRGELAELGEVPFFPVLGNHEVKLLGAFSLGQAHAEEAYRRNFLESSRTPVTSSLPNKIVYSVDLPGGVHFVALDNVSQSGFGADQLAWLAEDLDRAHRNPLVKHTIVGMHKPLARNGVSTHGMDKDGAGAIADSDAAVALFVKDGVDLILSSHVHGFAKFTQSGIASYITGGLGAPLTMAGSEHGFHHFLVIDARPGRLDVDVVRFDGTPNVGTDEIDD